MLDERVPAVMQRLEEEDRLEREQGLPSEVLGAYSRARQADPTLAGVTVPLDRGSS